MNPHVGAAMWIIAMLIGFVIWWPIGAMILGAITFTALMQQLTGYQLNPPPQPSQPLRPPLQPHWSETQAINPQLTHEELKRLKHTKVKLLTYKDKF